MGLVETVHAAAQAVAEYKAAHPEHCTECDGNGYHVADCPRADPENDPSPARCARCDRCGARLLTALECESMERLGYLLCDDCESEQTDGARGES